MSTVNKSHIYVSFRPKINVNEENVGADAEEIKERVGKSSCNNHYKQPKMDACTMQ